VKDDAHLIDDALAGSSAAFGQLVERYQDRLFNTLVHITGSAEDAQDIAQEAFVQAFLKLNTFQRSAAFYTWLYRIAFNLAVSQRRRRRPTSSLEHGRDLGCEDPVAPSTDPAASLEQQELAAQVQAAMNQLSDEFRSVLVLREIDGHDYDTIATMLDLPVGTVRSRLHRARLQLKDLLQTLMLEDLPLKIHSANG
jgi:RNA polymerase sigma-70 factor (ECF subfamily)